MTQSQVPVLVTELDWDAQRWNPWKNLENKEEDAMMVVKWMKSSMPSITLRATSEEQLQLGKKIGKNKSLSSWERSSPKAKPKNVSFL